MVLSSGTFVALLRRFSSFSPTRRLRRRFSTVLSGDTESFPKLSNPPPGCPGYSLAVRYRRPFHGQMRFESARRVESAETGWPGQPTRSLTARRWRPLSKRSTSCRVLLLVLLHSARIHALHGLQFISPPLLQATHTVKLPACPDNGRRIR